MDVSTFSSGTNTGHAVAEGGGIKQHLGLSVHAPKFEIGPESQTGLVHCLKRISGVRVSSELVVVSRPTLNGPGKSRSKFFGFSVAGHSADLAFKARVALD
jgi:hypothetical protein